MKPKILITDPVHQLLIDGLVQHGWQVEYKPSINYSKVLEEIDNYVGLIINSKIKADVQLIDKAVRLKFIGRLGSGLDVINLDYAEKKGIQYFNSPEGNCQAVAEHALGMLLSLLNNIPQSFNEVKQQLWLREKNRGVELNELTIGVIGYGHTGQAFARVLSGVGCKVLAYDKYNTSFPEQHVEQVSLERLYREADVISLHVQLTDETHYLIDQEFLERFAKPVYVINTSRGKVIKTADLLDALNNGRVIAAALDVLENEQPETFNESERKVYNLLVEHPGVLVTPHIAGWTHQSKRKIAEVVLEKIRKIVI